MGYIVVLIFVIAALLAFYEDFLGRYKLPIYLVLGTVLIILAGSREVGVDADSINYEATFLNHSSDDALETVEYSFILISKLVQLFSNDVHVLFFIYAFLGLTLKFFAFRKLSEFWFLPVVVYISYFYVLHELTQIRTGVMAGLFLLAIKPICEGKRLKAFLFIATGIFFHYSALVLLPLLFLSNKPMGNIKRTMWALIVPFGYMVYLYGFSALLDLSTELPYIGHKLAAYKLSTDKGLVISTINAFNPLFLITNLLYLYLLYFHDTIIAHNKYFPFMIKVFACSIFSYLALSGFPVMAERIHLLLLTVTIILYSNICYTIKPKWAGITASIFVAFAYINIAMPAIGLSLLWKKDT